MKRLTAGVAFPPDLRHPVHEALIDDEGSATQVALLTWGPVGDVSSLLWVDASQSTASALLAAGESMSEYQFLSTAGGTYAIVHQQAYDFPAPVLAVTDRAQTVFLPPLRFRVDGEIEITAVGSADGLTNLVEDLETIASVDIRSVEPYRRERPTAHLTDRQETALSVAVQLGYYAIPREASVADIAEELSCAPSTAGEIIRRAERSLISAHIDGDQSEW